MTSGRHPDASGEVAQPPRSKNAFYKGVTPSSVEVIYLEGATPDLLIYNAPVEPPPDSAPLAASRLTYASTGTYFRCNITPTFQLENHTQAASAACNQEGICQNRPHGFNWRTARRYAGKPRTPELRSPVARRAGHPRCLEREMMLAIRDREREGSKPRQQAGGRQVAGGCDVLIVVVQGWV
jgi:hypothetical protein